MRLTERSLESVTGKRGIMKKEITEIINFINNQKKSDIQNMPNEMIEEWKKELIKNRKTLAEISSKNGIGVFIRDDEVVTSWHYGNYPPPRKYG